MSAWIQTFTGRQFTFPARPENVDVQDIAHALAFQCRYSGHCQEFYSVAEHSVLLHDYALQVFHDHPGRVMLTQLLFHDAAEAYLTDLPSPVKRLLPDYQRLEEDVWKAICERLQIPYLMYSFVHEVDRRILLDERRALFGPSPEPWDLVPGGPLGVGLECWSPEQAEDEFLARAVQLALL